MTDREKIAQAISEADDSFGYSFNLTRLVDGEETHTLTMPGFEPIEFIDDREEGYRLIEERRNQVRADAILALSPPAVGDVERILSDPIAVHLNMLRGGIAKPSPANIWHLYGGALLDAMPEEYR